MRFDLRILGSNSAAPTISRNPSAQLLNIQERLLLIDCGEGTQMQLLKYQIKFTRINNIFISHLHGDHYFGLVGLISTFHLLGRKRKLNIYAFAELEPIIQSQLMVAGTELQYPLEFHYLKPETHEQIFENEVLTVESFPLDHRVPTCGFIFKEKKRDRKICKDFLSQEMIPVPAFQSIKSGNDYTNSKGKTYKNKDITIPAPKPRSFAYCSDTKYNERIIPIIRNVDMLYHETTFLKDKAKVALEKFHSTTIDAANIANKSNAKKLLIGHYSSRYKKLDEMLEEVKSVYENSFLTRDGDVFSVELGT